MSTNQTPLEGLFSRYPKARFWAYIAFALLSLLVSILLSMVVYNLIPEEINAAFINWMSWIAHILGLIGTAFGITAAANISDKPDYNPSVKG